MTLPPLALSCPLGVYEDSRSEISRVGQRKCNSLHTINSLVSKVCHLVGLTWLQSCLGQHDEATTTATQASNLHDTNNGRTQVLHYVIQYAWI